MRTKYYIQVIGEYSKREAIMKIYGSNYEKANCLVELPCIAAPDMNSQITKWVGHDDYELMSYTAKDRKVIYYYQSKNGGIHSTYIYPSKSAEGEYLWEFQSGDKLSHEQVYKKLQKKGYQYFKLIPIEQEQQKSSASASNFFAYLFLILLLVSMIIGNL